MKKTTSALAAVAALAAVSASHASTISTLGFWDGSTTISAWGGSATNTYGEVITAPGGSLTSFTFEVDNGRQPANFIAEIYDWNGSTTGGAGPQGTGGAPLYTSGPLTLAAGGLQAVTINTGGVALTAGQNYVIDLYDNSGDGVGGSWGLISPFFSHPGVVGDNGFNFNNGPSNAAQWDDFADFGSLAFSATFTSGAPEPASWALMMIGVAGLGGALRSSRKSAALAA